MKSLFTQILDIAPVSSKKFQNYRVQIHSETAEAATGGVL